MESRAPFRRAVTINNETFTPRKMFDAADAVA